MKCYYYIQLANGGEVRIPADFTPLSSSDKDLVAKIQSYQKALKEGGLDENKNELLNYLTEAKTGLSWQTLNSLVDRFGKDHLEKNYDEDYFIGTINDRLAQEGSYRDFYSLLRTKLWNTNEKFSYTAKNADKAVEINAERFKELIEQPVREKYLEDVKSIGVLGRQSIKDIKHKIQRQRDFKVDVGADSNLEDSLVKLINATFSLDLHQKDMFFPLDFSGKTNDSILIYPEDSQDPMIFYNEDNPASLFLSIYKYLGSELDPEDLAEVLKAYNEEYDSNMPIPESEEDVKEFFNGRFEDGVYHPGKFDSLLRSRQGTVLVKIGLAQKILDTWQEYYGLSENSAKNIRKSIYGLMPFVSVSNAYLSEFDKNRQEKDKFFTKEEVNQKTWLKNNFDQVKEYLSNKEYYYSENKNKSFDKASDAFAWLNNNINLKQDVIRMNRGGATYFVIPTEFILKGNSIEVKGFTLKKGKIDELGEDEQLDSKDFKNLVYRTLDSREPSTGELIYDQGRNAVVVYAENGDTLDPDIVKETARVGSRVVYLVRPGTSTEEKREAIVTAVLPSGLKTNVYDLKFDQNIKSITTDSNFYSDVEFTDEENEKKGKVLKSYTKVNQGVGDYKYIERGDIVLQNGDKKTYNRVVGVSGDTVYILIKSTIKEKRKEDKFQYRVTGISRPDVDTIYKKKTKVPKLPMDVGQALDDYDNNKSIKTGEFSFTDNIQEARNGDYFLFNGNTYVVVDKENHIYAKFTLDPRTKLVSLDYIKKNIEDEQIILVTERNISSKYAFSINELNNKRLHVSRPKTDKVVLEAVYLLPKNVDIKETLLLDSGSLDHGYSATKRHIQKNGVPADMMDVTKELSDLIALKTGETSTGKLYLTDSKGYYTKFNSHFFQADFSEFSKEQRNNYIQNNAYIFFKKDTKDVNLRNKTFRIVNIEDDNILIEYSRFSQQGNMVTLRKTMNKEEAFKDIKWLYLPWGNSKIPSIQKARDKQTKQEKRALVTEITKKFEDAFGLPTTILKNSPKGKTTKKAWIAAKDNPKVVINLGNEHTDYSDIVHEYMHLFLFALKHKNTKSYEDLIFSYRSKKMSDILDISKRTKQMESDLAAIESGDIDTIEEFLVDELSSYMAGKMDYTSVNEDMFVSAFHQAMNELGFEDVNVGSNMFDILSTNMGDIFTETKSKVANEGLILFEANFRQWLTKEIDNSNIELNCE